jgi:hypothetical protein
MGKKIIKLDESDLTRIVKRVIEEYDKFISLSDFNIGLLKIIEETAYPSLFNRVNRIG